MEYNTAIYSGGAIAETKGNRLAVRAQMRFAMLHPNDEDDNSNSLLERNNRNAKIVVNLYMVSLHESFIY